MTPIDPVTLVVVQNGLQQVASEMDLTFERAAFSPVISEGFDRSDGIYIEGHGDVIAQGELGLPIFVGVMQFTTRAVIEQSGAARRLEPGDIFLVNDPYCGGTHLMDVKMVKPFFYRGRLWAWLANTGHWPDTGGSVPGGFSTRATEVQQEGLRLPPVKLFRAGVMDDDILSIILANIRVPEERIGDIKAQVAALTVGEKRLTALLDRYGDETVTACIAELRRRSEQMMRAHIAKIPDGIYTGEAVRRLRRRRSPTRWPSASTSRRRAPISTSTSRSRARRAAARSTASSRPRRPPCTWPSSTSSPTCRSTPAASSRCTSPTRTARSSTRATRGRSPAARPRSARASRRACSPRCGRAIPDDLFAAPAGTSGNLTLGGYDPLKERHYIMYVFSGGGYGGSAEDDGLTNGCSTIGISKTQPDRGAGAALPASCSSSTRCASARAARAARAAASASTTGSASAAARACCRS